jgi:phosphoribosylformylglycinamidine cyclo-ligase
VLEQRPGSTELRIDGKRLIDWLLEPTRIYSRSVLAVHAETRLKGLAHITGGGLIENIPRVLPAGLGVRLARRSWPRPAVFEWLAEAGIAEPEMHRTFNCGIGMVAVVDADRAERVVAALGEQGERAWIVGEVIEDEAQRVHVG